MQHSYPTNFDYLPHLWLSSLPLTLFLTFDSLPHLWLFSSPLTLFLISNNLSRLWLSSSPLTVFLTSDSLPHLWLSSSPLTLFLTSYSLLYLWLSPSPLTLFLTSNSLSHPWLFSSLWLSSSPLTLYYILSLVIPCSSLLNSITYYPPMKLYVLSYVPVLLSFSTPLFLSKFVPHLLTYSPIWADITIVFKNKFYQSLEPDQLGVCKTGFLHSLIKPWIGIIDSLL